MPLTVGTRMGRYVLNRLLGVGGMAEVWEATDEVLGRPVAVKVILPSIASDPEFAPRFIREGRLAAALEHPHILPVYDYGTENDSAYIVQRLVPGGNLAQRLTRPIATSDALDWLTAVADALDYAHAHKVVHRDVKPANILFDETGRPYLADFGVAKDLGADAQLTITGTVVGTPNFMGPEQATGQGAVPASDQYALGILAYLLLAERLPFEGMPTPVVLYKTIYETLPPPSSFVSQLPPEVDKAILKALSKKPADRHATCMVFVRALRRALEEAQTNRFPTAESAPSVPAVRREAAAEDPAAAAEATVARDETAAPTGGPGPATPPQDRPVAASAAGPASPPEDRPVAGSPGEPSGPAAPSGRRSLLLLAAVVVAVLGFFGIRELQRRGEPSHTGPEPAAAVTTQTPEAPTPEPAPPTPVPTEALTPAPTPVPSASPTTAAARPTAVPRRTHAARTPSPTPPISAPATLTPLTPLTPLPPLAPPAAIDVAAVRTLYVPPIYPRSAQAARAQGTVVIEVTVTADGSVGSARIVRGVDPSLDEAALRAVRQWKYRPAQRNGVPVDSTFSVSVAFRLSARPGA